MAGRDFASELAPLARVQAVLEKMLGEDGCAWHREQTHATLMRYLVEESAEVVDAYDRELPPAEIAEELGDLLYQIVLHAGIASRDGEGYDFDSIAARLAQKLIDRHPHVFSDRGYMSAQELNSEWENLKADAAGAAADGAKSGADAQTKPKRAVFDGIPKTMPTLARATKMVSRLYKDEFDIENSADSDTIGAELLAIVERAHRSGVDADQALRLALIGLENEHSSKTL